jgi:hypothetical protein
MIRSRDRVLDRPLPPLYSNPRESSSINIACVAAFWHGCSSCGLLCVCVCTSTLIHIRSYTIKLCPTASCASRLPPTRPAETLFACVCEHTQSIPVGELPGSIEFTPSDFVCVVRSCANFDVSSFCITCVSSAADIRLLEKQQIYM